MKNKKIALGLVLGAAVPAFFGAAAAKAEQPWSLEVAAGVQYDGNVNVEQLDILTSESDFAGLFEASAAYELSGSAGSACVRWTFSNAANVRSSSPSFLCCFQFAANLGRDSFPFEMCRRDDERIEAL